MNVKILTIVVLAISAFSCMDLETKTKIYLNADGSSSLETDIMLYFEEGSESKRIKPEEIRQEAQGLVEDMYELGASQARVLFIREGNPTHLIMYAEFPNLEILEEILDEEAEYDLWEEQTETGRRLQLVINSVVPDPPETEIIAAGGRIVYEDGSGLENADRMESRIILKKPEDWKSLSIYWDAP